MGKPTPPVVTLANLARGAADQLFDASLQKVVENILDINTDLEAVRTISLEVTIKPVNTDRSQADVKVKAKTKLAGLCGAETVIYLGRHAGRPVAVEHDPRQIGMFDNRTDEVMDRISKEVATTDGKTKD
jgi:hypothetical protein